MHDCTSCNESCSRARVPYRSRIGPEPDNAIALEARAASLEALLEVAENSNMQGWLFAALREVEAKLDEQ